jgi:hypothetical protein
MTKIQPKGPEEPEEGQRLFHSQMWVNGVPLHFIVDNESQNNLMSIKVVNQLNFLTTPHLQTHNIEWLS